MAPPGAAAAPKAKEILLSFWWPPPPSETTEARYKQIVDAGFNTVMAGNGIEGPELSHKMLDLCAKLGLKAFVLDNRLYGGKVQDVGGVVKEYSSSPALAGYMVKDEPNSGEFKGLAATVAALKKEDGKHLAFINLFPTYASPQQLGSPSYEEHVKSYLDAVRPQLLCYDHYPFLTQGLRPDVFQNLDIARRQAQKAGVPFWTFVQSEGIEGAYRSPSPSEMRWQVFQSLAFGAKGILYFTYWTPEPGGEKHFDGILGRDGKARGRYAAVQEINAEVKGLAPVLAPLTVADVYHTVAPTPGSKNLEPGNGLHLISVTGDPVTLSDLRGDGGKRYAFVVNQSYARPATVALLFDGTVVEVSEALRTGGYGPNRLRPELTLKPEIKVTLDPGDGRLFLVNSND
jgi:hypothetical protein